MNSEFFEFICIHMRAFLSASLRLRGRNPSRDVLSGQFGNIFVESRRKKSRLCDPRRKGGREQRSRYFSSALASAVHGAANLGADACASITTYCSSDSASHTNSGIRIAQNSSVRRVIAAIAPSILVIEVRFIRIIVIHRSPITGAVSRIRLIGIGIEPGPIIAAVVHPVIVWHPIPPFAIVKHESPAIGIVIPICLPIITAPLRKSCRISWRDHARLPAGLECGRRFQRHGSRHYRD